MPQMTKTMILLRSMGIRFELLAVMHFSQGNRVLSAPTPWMTAP